MRISSAPSLSYLEQLLLKRSRRGLITTPKETSTDTGLAHTDDASSEEILNQSRASDHGEADSTEQSGSWLAEQLARISLQQQQSLVAPAPGSDWGDVSFEEVDDDDTVDGEEAVVWEPAESQAVSGAGVTGAATDSWDDDEVQIVDLQDHVKETLSRAATAQRVLEPSNGLGATTPEFVESSEATESTVQADPVLSPTNLPIVSTPTISTTEQDVSPPAPSPASSPARLPSAQAGQRMASAQRELQVRLTLSFQ